MENRSEFYVYIAVAYIITYRNTITLLYGKHIEYVFLVVKIV